MARWQVGNVTITKVVASGGAPIPPSFVFRDASTEHVRRHAWLRPHSEWTHFAEDHGEAGVECDPHRLFSTSPRDTMSPAHVGGIFGSRLLATTALVAVTALLPGMARAQDATWLPTPGSANFNDGANWNTATVPTGTAIFDASSITALSFSANTAVGGLTFNAGAPAYSFNNNRALTFVGAGIIGGSATITNNGTLNFNLNSTAGNATIINNVGKTWRFSDNSTAGTAIITNFGNLRFFETSTAGSAIITNNSDLNFNNTSTAGTAAAFTNNAALGVL